MITALRLSHRFGALNAQYQANKSRNAVRFEAQNIIWDYEEVNYQTQAFAKGLASLNIQKSTIISIKTTTFCSESHMLNKLRHLLRK